MVDSTPRKLSNSMRLRCRESTVALPVLVRPITNNPSSLQQKWRAQS